MKTKNRGFSLLELSVIVLVLGMISLLAWRFIVARFQHAENVVARSLLERADGALTGFVFARHRLPCPDTNTDGLEDCGATAQGGSLPYKTLGMADTRAGTIRYGVLRRVTAANDPEAVPLDDPAPPLPRNADLAESDDRFYPLVGWVGVFGAFGASPFLTDLSSAPAEMPANANRALGNANGIDFCQTLRVAEDPKPASDVANHAHVQQNGPRQIAYALALPGARDANGDGDLFDGPALPGFDSPQKAPTHNNDDRVRAVSPGVLWNRLGCGEILAASGHAQPNAATAAAMLYRSLFDYEQLLTQGSDIAQANLDLTLSALISAVASRQEANSAAEHATGDLARDPTRLPAVQAAATMKAAAAMTEQFSYHALLLAYQARLASQQGQTQLEAMRSSAKSFAEEIATRVQDADQKGLYLGR